MLCMALLALCACGSPSAPEEITTPATEAPTLPIEYPASYKDAPEAYWPVLNDLLKWIFVVDNRWDFSLSEDWGIHPGIHMISESAVSSAGEYIGYAIHDINNDGTPELIILFSPSEKLCPLALFTLQDNTPVHLFTYHHREVGDIAEDGTIYVTYALGSGSGNMRSYALEPGTAKLTMLTDYHYHVDYNDDSRQHYRIEGDERIYTREEIDALSDKYYRASNPMKLTFIPIEQ